MSLTDEILKLHVWNRTESGESLVSREAVLGVVAGQPEMKTNLKWIEQQWESWLESEVARRIVRHPSTIKQHSEHVAKLFAAFCVEELRRP